jgi:hypothetical protein
MHQDMIMSQHTNMKKATANALFYAAALIGAAVTGGLFASSSAYAQAETSQQRNTVSIRSEILVERITTENGKTKTELLDPKKVTVIPGDKLIVSNFYENEGTIARDNYVATNPIHPAVAFVSVDEKWAEVSIDGGKTWGKLQNLTKAVDAVETGESTRRPAAPGDVTHIRWRFDKPLPSGAKGKLTFRGVVR